MKLDEQIRINLRSAAQTVPRTEHGPVERIETRGRRRRRNRQLGVVGVVVLLALGTVYVTGLRPEAFLADGERLLSTDPPIVQGAEAPEPEFDTSNLGSEASLTPIIDIDRILDLAEREAEGEIIRVTVLGETPDGVDAVVVHSEREDPDLGRIQTRCVVTDIGGSCTGTQIENVLDEPGGFLPPEPGRFHGYAVDSLGGRGDLAWEVPADASVVTLSVNGDTTWQRPIANVAIFITHFRDGDGFELAAFDAQGNVLDRVSQLVRLDSGG